jgi:hypothetical protein
MVNFLVDPHDVGLQHKAHSCPLGVQREAREAGPVNGEDMSEAHGSLVSFDSLDQVEGGGEGVGGAVAGGGGGQEDPQLLTQGRHS